MENPFLVGPWSAASGKKRFWDEFTEGGLNLFRGPDAPFVRPQNHERKTDVKKWTRRIVCTVFDARSSAAPDREHFSSIATSAQPQRLRRVSRTLR